MPANDLDFLLRGVVLGFSIAAPVGPIGVLCIRRTLAQGRLVGLISGLGAATADALYGSIAAFGLTLLSTFLVSQQFWLRLVGGLFLIFLGVRTFLAKPAAMPTAEASNPPAHTAWLGAYFSTLLLTLTNPLTILSFAAIFSGLGVASQAGDWFSGLLIVLGVFLGSALWWLLLSGGVSLFQSRLAPGALTWINRLSGVILFGFGWLALSAM